MGFISNKISKESITNWNYWPCEVNGSISCLGLWNLSANHPSISECAYARVINMDENWKTSDIGLMIQKVQSLCLICYH